MIAEPYARPPWQTVWYQIADVLAQRSTCPRLQTAAVIVNDQHQILSTGYNGAPRLQPHCLDIGCLMVDGHCKRAVHAEINAVAQAALLGHSINHATIYILHRPCLGCAIVLNQAGIARVFYRQSYDSDHGLDEVALLFNRASIEFHHMP